MNVLKTYPRTHVPRLRREPSTAGRQDLHGVAPCSYPAQLCGREKSAAFQAGFTLIEMLIAMAISVVVLGGAFNYFNGVEGMTQSVSSMSQVNENLRGAVSLMSRDLYAAGTGITNPASGIPLPNGTGSTPVKRPGAGNATFPVSTNNGVLSVITPGQGLSGVIDPQSAYTQASDEITILKEDPAWTGQSWSGANQNWNLQSLSVATQSGNSEITYSASSGYAVTATFANSGPSACSACASISKGDLLLFTSVSEGSALGMVTIPPVFATSGSATTVTLTFGSDSLGLNQACAAQGCTGTIDSLAPSSQPGVYPAGITLTKIDMITYYLSNSNANHPYTLIRVLGDGTNGDGVGSAVAYGIAGLRVTYDAVSTASPPQLDLGDPNPMCGSTQCPNQIRTVHLALYGTANSSVQNGGQPYQSSLFSSVALQNLEYSNQF